MHYDIMLIQMLTYFWSVLNLITYRRPRSVIITSTGSYCYNSRSLNIGSEFDPKPTN